jgi:hypothetical protein
VTVAHSRVWRLPNIVISARAPDDQIDRGRLSVVTKDFEVQLEMMDRERKRDQLRDL